MEPPSNEELYVCMNCGASAITIEALCNPDDFQAKKGCDIPKRIFTDVPVHGGCRQMVYVCARCGIKSMSNETICQPQYI